MEIKNIDKGIIDKLSPRVAREETPAESRPRTDQTSDRREPTQAVESKRPPPLLATVSRSLAQSGLAVANADAVPASAEADPDKLASRTETEVRQAEKAAEALRAFMHSLIKAVNPGETAPAPGPAVANASPPTALGDAERGPSLAASAYEGMASRLEGLVQTLSGDQSSSRSNQELARLDSAFRDLLSVSADRGSGSAPDLQTVLKNMIRNLQSTGDPTLASTGNVINTAA